MNTEKLVATELADLKNRLLQGDEVVTEISPVGKVVSHSKVVGDARIAFMNKIKILIGAGEITPSEATKATQLFGKQTTKLFWINPKSKAMTTYTNEEYLDLHGHDDNKHLKPQISCGEYQRLSKGDQMQYTRFCGSDTVYYILNLSSPIKSKQ